MKPLAQTDTSLPELQVASTATPVEHNSLDERIALLEADASNVEQRFIRDLAELSEIVSALRARGKKIVLTSGSFDIIHQGHAMYVEAARELAGPDGFLVVGVDSDAKVRSRKNRNAAVPELERVTMIAHQRGVGLVTVKEPTEEKWALIKAVRPDVLVATEDTYRESDIALLEREYCGKVEVLARMATISTSARLRDLLKRMSLQMEPEVKAQTLDVVDAALDKAMPEVALAIRASIEKAMPEIFNSVTGRLDP